MNTISERISLIINEFCNGKNTELAKLTGTSEANIRNYIAGTQPKFDFLSKLISKLDVNIKWLMTGEGDMLIREDESENISVQSFSKSYDKQVGLQQVPLYDFNAVAGLTPIFDGQGNPVDYISIPGLPKVDGAVAICGDSMYPLLKSGDIVIFKTLNDLHNIIWGEMYLVSFGNDGDDYTSVKYVKKIDAKPDYVELVSYNHHHAPMEIHKECIRAIALVKASVRFNAM